ncbi:MAG TPA: hypothetical protein VH763_12790 [Gemmatimonadales bacterium]|jgi:hypothetical protein
MRKPFALLMLLLPAGAASLTAQTDYYLRIGAIGASNLLRDGIVSEITVRQSIAPLLVVGGSLPLRQGYRAGLEGNLSSGGFHSTESGVETDLGTLRTASLQLDLSGPIARQIRWWMGLGGLFYLPKDDEGIFLQGGTTRLLAGIGTDWRMAVLPRWDLMTSLRYDFHRFTTEELKARGFGQSQGISRFSLSIGLARGHR